MIVKVLILCFLAYNPSAASAGNPKQVTENQQARLKSIEGLTSQGRQALATLAKEALSSTPDYDAIDSQYRLLNDAIFKIRFFDAARAQSLAKERQALSEQISQAVIKKINAANIIIKKIYYKDFFKPEMIKSLQETFQDIFNALDTSLAIVKLPIIQKHIAENDVQKDTFNRLFHSLTQQMNTLFSQIMKGLSNQLVERSQLNVLDSLIDNWQNLIAKINDNDLDTPLPETNTLKTQRAMIDKNAWVSDLNNASKQLHELIETIQEGSSNQSVETLSKKFTDYLTKYNRVLDELPTSPIKAGFEKRHAIIEQEVKNMFLLGYSNLIKYAAQQFIVLNSSKDLKTIQTTLMAQRSSRLLAHDPANPWIILDNTIKSITQLYQKYNENLAMSTASKTYRQAIKDAIKGLTSHITTLLSKIEKIMKDKKPYYTMSDYELTQAAPKIYGRILGQYEQIIRIVADLKVMELSPEIELAPFKRTHKEIVQISDAIEQAMLKKSRAATASPASSSSAAGSGSAVAPTAPKLSIDLKEISDK